MLWYLFLSVEAACAIIVINIFFVLSVMNAVFLYAMIDKQRNEQDRFFKFDTNFKWLKPTTMYVPFEFKFLVCNYVIVKLSVFGWGFEFQLWWFDAPSETIEKSKQTNPQKNKTSLPKHPKKTKYPKNVKETILNSIQTPPRPQHTVYNMRNIDKLKKVSALQIPRDLSESTRDLSTTSTLAMKTEIRKQHKRLYKK